MGPKEDFLRFRYSVYMTMTFVAILWFVHSLLFALEVDQRQFGILPRTLHGAIGIVTSPLVHGDLNHLMGNTIPLLALGIGLFYFYRHVALRVFFIIYALTGIFVWLLARSSSHIGASGIVYGIISFLLFSGLFRRDMRSVAISLIVIFLYGGMAAGLIPLERDISYESHWLGFGLGFVCALFYRKTDMALGETSPMPEDQDIEGFSHTGSQEYNYFYEYKDHLPGASVEPEADEDTKS